MEGTSLPIAEMMATLFLICAISVLASVIRLLINDKDSDGSESPNGKNSSVESNGKQVEVPKKSIETEPSKTSPTVPQTQPMAPSKQAEPRSIKAAVRKTKTSDKPKQTGEKPTTVQPQPQSNKQTMASVKPSEPSNTVKKTENAPRQAGDKSKTPSVKASKPESAESSSKPATAKRMLKLPDPEHVWSAYRSELNMKHMIGVSSKQYNILANNELQSVVWAPTKQAWSNVDNVRVPVVAPPPQSKTFDPVYPSGLSLESCEGDPNSPCIQFTSHVVLERVMEKLNTVGDIYRSDPIPLYFNHVLHSFRFVLSNYNDDEFELHVFCDTGAHLTPGPLPKYQRESLYDASRLKDDNDNNDVRGLEELKNVRVEIEFTTAEGKKKEKIVLKGNDLFDIIFQASHRIKKDKIRQYTQYNSETKTRDFHCEAHLFVERTQFTLAPLLKAIPLTPSKAENRTKVRKIANGQNPDIYDWKIMVHTSKDSKITGKSTDFGCFIAKAKLQSFGSKFANAFKPNASQSDKNITVNSESKTIHLSEFASEDMEMLIAMIYGERIPLIKSWKRAEKFVSALFGVVEVDKIESMIHDWEHEIINRALAIDPELDSSESFAEIISLLVIIWTFPRGKMPLAKRVAIGVLADMMYLHMNKEWSEIPDAIFDKIHENSIDLTQNCHLHPILHSAMMHNMKVRSVRKRGVSAVAKS